VPEPAGAWLRRLALALALVVAALAEVYALVHTVHAQASQRERVVREERRIVTAAIPRVTEALASGDGDSARQAVKEFISLSGAWAIEVFELEGRLILAYPERGNVKHWPSAQELGKLRGGSVLTVGPLGGEPGRVYSYVVLRSSDGLRLLRLAREAPDLLTSLRDGQRLMMIHGAALVVLVLALGLVVSMRLEGAASSAHALRAYEEAMGRLHAQGQELVVQHRAERRLLEAHIEDQDAMARAGELTAGIVHEVRNGLATIVGHATLLEAQPEAADSAGAIHAECETLESVIRRFMEFIKREQLNAAPVSLRRVLERVAARESRNRGGAVVSLEPPSGADEILGADEELLERAFENLVRNAREAAGPKGHVTVAIEAKQGGCSVRIGDDGPGLAPELLAGPRPFLSTKPGGLGLGLVLALKIIGLHGGSLEFSENGPRGLAVTVLLPRSVTPGDSGVTRGSSDAAIGTPESRDPGGVSH
jgi:signal transduction histidine kinase